MPRFIKLGVMVLMLSVFCPGIAQAQEPNALFKYTTNYQFETNCTYKTTLGVLYDFSHLKNFMTDVHRLEISNKTRTSYNVTYHYEYLFYKSSLVFEKKLIKEKDLIVFSLIRSWHNMKSMPAVVDVRGYWQVEKSSMPGKLRVRYSQTSVFDSEIGFFYRSILKRRTLKFLISLKRYLEETK